MRVGLVCPYSLSWPGGVQTHVLGLAGELARRGHVVRVLAPCDTVPPSPLVDPAGPSVAVAANGSIAHVALAPAAWRTAARWPARRRLDVVHVHEPLVPTVSLGVTATSDVPMVGTFHAAADRWWPYERAGRALRHATDRLTASTAVSDAAEALASRHFPGIYERTPNAIDLRRYDEVGPDPLAPPVLFLGRLEPRKGAGVLVEAARWIGTEVGIAGEGSERGALEAAAPASVRFLGAPSERAKAALLRGTSVLCAPALGGESFGFVLLEAMAAGAVVVASDIPGYAAVVGDAGVLVAPGDAPALAAAVRVALEDPGDLRERGRARAEEMSWERRAGRVEELYRAAI